MTRQQHYAEAERLLQSVLPGGTMIPTSAAAVTLVIATAQVHATLALADSAVDRPLSRHSQTTGLTPR